MTPARRHGLDLRRRAERGFTLIELTVALLAGLIVGLGVVALSRDSTRTFHEEMRASAAEANLRTATDRLRADLARAGYMSTGDIANDPMIAKAPGVLNPAPPGFLGLAELAALQYNTSTAAANGLSLSTPNGVNPSALLIGGNMTANDQFSGSLQPGNVGGCTKILLNPQTPAMYRVLNSSSPATELNNLFQPVPAGVNGQFMVRVVDKGGHTQYLVTCAGGATGITGGAPNWQPWVAFDPATPVQTAAQTFGVSNLTGIDSGDVWVNPVQLVRWEIMAASKEPVQYTSSPLAGEPLSATTIDPTKYDLVRSYIDAKTGKTISQTSEVVAEYAVDLDFAFSVDIGTNLQPSIVTYPFGQSDNLTWGQALSKQTIPPVSGPARIRSVHVRLVTRAAQADRTLNVAVPAPAGSYMYRYCIIPGGCNPVNATGILQYARARTLTFEVALPNEASAFYL